MSATDQFDTPMIFSLTVWGEARGEGSTGQQAVCNVIMNRVKSGTTWWGDDPRSVCLKPFQFSCWNENDPNLPLMMKIGQNNGLVDITFDQIQTLAQMALEDNLPDVTNGATSYYAKGTPEPAWAQGKQPCANIGHHLFFMV